MVYIYQPLILFLKQKAESGTYLLIGIISQMVMQGFFVQYYQNRCFCLFVFSFSFFIGIR